MDTARKAYRGLAYLFIALVLLQVFLAGLGLANFGGSDSDLDPHRALGEILSLVALVLCILGFFGKVGRTLLIPTLALLVMVVLQSVWVHVDGRVVHAIHPAMAIVIFATGHYIAQHAPR